MVLEVIDRREFEGIVKRGRLVLVLFYDSASPHGRYLAGLLDSIARQLEPVFVVARVDSSYAGWAREVGSLPRLVLFHEGVRVWEQIGFFYDSVSDRFAIRRGLLHALRRRGLSPAGLGVSLLF